MYSSEVQVLSLPLTIPVISHILLFIPSLLLSAFYYFYTVINPESHPPNQKYLFREYDFIIVGAGSAGAVVASRLSENVFDQVLLLEAGGDENEISDIPALAFYLQHSDMDWKYKTEPQDNACLAYAERRCSWPRGKVLGGSSTINYLMYVRGNKRDYDQWAEAGNPGWSFDDVLPYFKKSEDQKNPYLATNTMYHSTGGYQTVSEPIWRTPLADLYIKAGIELGYKNQDYNSRFQSGFSVPQATIRDGTRISTSKAFLRPANLRKNLHVAKNSFVTKIIIDTETMRATGVRFIRKGKVYTIMARKEIILSAGSINTPQLLMLSGIGPRAHLESLGIPVIREAMGVGRNLQDHISTGGIIFLIDEKISLQQPRIENLWAALKYTLFGKGPLAAAGGLEGLAFVSTTTENELLDFPDIEFHILSSHPGLDGGRQVAKAIGFTDDRFTALYSPISFKDGFNPYPMLLRPLSRGYIELRSTNPFHKPIINPMYLTDEDGIDLATLVEGSKIAIAMGKTETMRSVGARLYTKPMPGCEQFPDAESNEYLECLTKHATTTIYHPVGTAKMGPSSDEEAVVDAQLRVHGIAGLRVADGSIMPTIVSGNTNAPIIMIGEKASDMIKEFWSKKRRK